MLAAASKTKNSRDGDPVPMRLTTSTDQFKLVPVKRSSSAAAATNKRHHSASRWKRLTSPHCWLWRAFRWLCPCLNCCTFKRSIRTTSGRSRRSGCRKACLPPWNCLCCYCSFPLCCCVRPATVNAQSSEDLCDLIRNCGTSANQHSEIAIDEYVTARYRYTEVHVRPPPSQTHESGVGQMTEMVTPTAAVVVTAAAAATSSTPQVHKRGKKSRLKKHFWNWNDSLKSNSDKFLESLEYDAMLGGGGGSNSLKKYKKISNCSLVEGILGDGIILLVLFFKINIVK